MRKIKLLINYIKNYFITKKNKNYNFDYENELVFDINLCNLDYNNYENNIIKFDILELVLIRIVIKDIHTNIDDFINICNILNIKFFKYKNLVNQYIFISLNRKNIENIVNNIIDINENKIFHSLSKELESYLENIEDIVYKEKQCPFSMIQNVHSTFRESFSKYEDDIYSNNFSYDYIEIIGYSLIDNRFVNEIENDKIVLDIGYIWVFSSEDFKYVLDTYINEYEMNKSRNLDIDLYIFKINIRLFIQLLNYLKQSNESEDNKFYFKLIKILQSDKYYNNILNNIDIIKDINNDLGFSNIFDEEIEKEEEYEEDFFNKIIDELYNK